MVEDIGTVSTLGPGSSVACDDIMFEAALVDCGAPWFQSTSLSESRHMTSLWTGVKFPYPMSPLPLGMEL